MKRSELFIEERILLMNITKSQLRHIIKEETLKVLKTLKGLKEVLRSDSERSERSERSEPATAEEALKRYLELKDWVEEKRTNLDTRGEGMISKWEEEMDDLAKRYNLAIDVPRAAWP